MADIRRIASPLTPLEENLHDDDYIIKKLQQKKKFDNTIEKNKSLLIGSIKEINKKVCEFEDQLASFDTRLEIQSRAEERTEKSRDGMRFGNTYKKSLDAEARKNKRAIGRKKVIKTEVPQLVELQEYPGFDHKQPTPLPHGVTLNMVNRKLLSALPHLNNKPSYRELFVKALNSCEHEEMLKDFFWWIFIEKYAPNKDVQRNLFKRIAKNYGYLFLNSGTQRFRDVFFSEYGEVMAQGLYSSYCLAYPQSWRQFDDETFKCLLSQTCNMSMSGINIFPRSHQKWNLHQLEPNNMRVGDNFKSGNKKKTGSVGVQSSMTIARSVMSKLSFDSDIVKQRNFQKNKKKSVQSRCVIPKTKEVSRNQDNNESSSALDPRHFVFSHGKFNLSGGSPLLNEFLHDWGIGRRRSGFDNIVPRTEVTSLPRQGCTTLNDVIESSKKLTSNARSKFERIEKSGRAAHGEFKSKHQRDKQHLDAKTEKLFENRGQISQLSNMVMAEYKADPSVPPREAQRAIWLAAINAATPQ